MKDTHYTTEQLHELPTDPGVYQFYDKEGVLIYVGKAKNLKKRVRSYFNKQSHVAIKTRKMVEKIRQIKCVLVNNEYEAFLLENNLIKEKQPRYNILLKDGKTYPYLCLTDEPFPRLISTRQRKANLGSYFGPFTSTSQMEEIQELIRELYPLRTCRYDLSEKNITAKKFKVCLEYHLGNCLGPCEGLQSEEAYSRYVAHVRHLLKGNFQQVKKELKATAQALAKKEQYLEAQQYKRRLEAIERYQAKSVIIHPSFGNLDVLVLKGEGDYAFVHYFYVQAGAIVFAETTHVKRKLGETEEDILPKALYHFREAAQSRAKEVLSSKPFAPLPEGVALTLPQQGDKRKLVELALKNLFFFQRNYLNEKVKKARASRSTLMRLQQDLGLREVPLHIECFDNSNLQGTHPVAGMVCFKKGLPAKRYYRHFHVKSVQGPDDFASMYEIIKRHYSRQLESHEALPDLILIDGGKGQISAAMKALKELGIHEKTAVIGIAKRLELIFRAEDSEPLYISKTSSSLRLLQQIRDEAHRFALTFHRKIRGKRALESELEDIHGIGGQTIERLLDDLGSVTKMKEASLEQLAVSIGASKAAKLYAHFHEQKEKVKNSSTEVASKEE